MQAMRQVIEWTALGIELLAVAVIAGAIVTAVFPCAMQRGAGQPAPADAFSGYKQRMGRGLLLGLELLLAADIVGTVALAPTLERLTSLALLAVIRSFLSWSLDVEINGCWPWRLRAERRLSDNVQSAGPAPTAIRE